ncbi:MAG TPA: histidine--tRNA ligase, partial [Sphingomonas sp.]|nr:histidine--tRNA ligase [Sphingomonas sp.]
EPAALGINVAVVVEDDAAGADGVRIVTALRRAGLVAELVATGSARKRYDKALKLDPAATVSLRADGITPRALRGDLVRIEAALGAL